MSGRFLLNAFYTVAFLVCAFTAFVHLMHEHYQMVRVWGLGAILIAYLWFRQDAP